MSPALLKILAVLMVLGPVVGEAIDAYQAGKPISFAVLFAAISGAVGGSQLLPRGEDTTPGKLAAKVEQAVSDRLSGRAPE